LSRRFARKSDSNPFYNLYTGHISPFLYYKNPIVTYSPYQLSINHFIKIGDYRIMPFTSSSNFSSTYQNKVFKPPTSAINFFMPYKAFLIVYRNSIRSWYLKLINPNVINDVLKVPNNSNKQLIKPKILENYETAHRKYENTINYAASKNILKTLYMQSYYYSMYKEGFYRFSIKKKLKKNISLNYLIRHGCPLTLNIVLITEIFFMTILLKHTFHFCIIAGLHFIVIPI
jgi:hypothetical protein